MWFNSCARQRWRILAKAIQLQKRSMLLNSHQTNAFGEREDPLTPNSTLISTCPVIDVMRMCEKDASVLDSSVRRFGGFGLIKCTPMIAANKINQSNPSFDDDALITRLCGQSQNWYSYQMQLHGSSQVFTLNVHHVLEMVSVSELMGFNNTGNICLWPSEEALGAYILENKGAFKNKSVLELGGGMTCLAALLLAKYCDPYLVHLTDGNSKSVENVKMIVRMNELGSKCFLKTSVLKWEEEEARVGGINSSSTTTTTTRKYDFIMCADCLFFDETRDSLIAAIDALLQARGQALVMAPRRGNTFQQFIDGCLARDFKVAVVDRYSESVWQQLVALKALQGEEYNEDIHYPILIVLTRGEEHHGEQREEEAVV